GFARALSAGGGHGRVVHRPARALASNESRRVMSLSRDSVLALQRHFLGALSNPASTWLELLPPRRLVYSGMIVAGAGDDCLLDFGTVVSPGEECRTVRVSNPGAEALEVRIADMPPWTWAGWLETSTDAVTIAGNGESTLELRASHDSDGAFDGTMQLAVTGRTTRRVEALTLRMVTRRLH